MVIVAIKDGLYSSTNWTSSEPLLGNDAFKLFHVFRCSQCPEYNMFIQNTRLYRKRRQRCTEITKREMLGKWKMTEIR